MKTFLLLLSFMVFSVQATDLKTVEKVEIPAYLGQWYEVARMPAFFQKNCLTSQAKYEQVDALTLKVINTCDTVEGKVNVAEGTAKVRDLNSQARLQVYFNFFSKLFSGGKKGNYWVLKLGELNENGQYTYSVVASPDKKYLWVLSRTPQLDQTILDEIIAEATDLGFATEKLIINN